MQSSSAIYKRAEADVAKYRGHVIGYSFIGNKKKRDEAKVKLVAAMKLVKKHAPEWIKETGAVIRGDFTKVDKILNQTEFGKDVIGIVSGEEAKKGLQHLDRDPLVQTVVGVAEGLVTGDADGIDSILNPQKTFLNTSGALELSKKVTKDAGMRILGFLEAIGRAILIPFVAIYEVFKAIATGDAPNMNSYFHTIKQSFTLEK